MRVQLGLERLLDSHVLDGKAVGLVCNPASVDGELQHAADRLSAQADVQLAALFGPQHGFRSDLQENMIESPHGADRRRRVPVYSLYSDTRQPTPAMLAGLDALVIDLQDVGTRIYTFIYTMAGCLGAARAQGLPVVVCDRPNPLGGEAVEGPMLDPAFASFVGEYPIPMRHGLTIGELARLFNDGFGIGAKLEVVAMRGWTRGAYFDATGLTWVLPSPNLPTLESALVYPGTVLLEGTNVSEGRGTTRPFELVGAPWIDPEPFTDGLTALGLPGVRFRPVQFEPTFHKHAGVACGGCQIHVTDRATFRPVETGVAVLAASRTAGPMQFAWREPPYEYEYSRPPIDILYGSAGLRDGLAAGVPVRTLAAEWPDGLRPFLERRQPYLLY